MDDAGEDAGNAERRPVRLATQDGFFNPLVPDASGLRLDTIGRSLSRICRYGGHGDRFYSVAEHSVLVATAVDELGGDDTAIAWALLHDAAEAFLGDWPGPLKRRLVVAGGYGGAVHLDGLERDWLRAIAGRFGLPPELPAVVVDCDRRVLADEMAVLFPGRDLTAFDLPQPLGELPVHGLSPEAAYDTWIEAACEAMLRHQGVLR